jgi:hypothetical protein
LCFSFVESENIVDNRGKGNSGFFFFLFKIVRAAFGQEYPKMKSARESPNAQARGVFVL